MNQTLSTPNDQQDEILMKAKIFGKITLENQNTLNCKIVRLEHPELENNTVLAISIKGVKESFYLTFDRTELMKLIDNQ